MNREAIRKRIELLRGINIDQLAADIERRLS
jgi:hypothetical protein